MSNNFVLVTPNPPVAVITLNRPEKKNALFPELIHQLAAAVEDLELNHQIKAIVLNSNSKDFCAGVDINFMREQSFPQVYVNQLINEKWEKISTLRKPIIAAINGYCLGGGFELAMMCDFMIASSSAKFGQPEIKIGIMPGIGGSQRLARYVGKFVAMELCLTGRIIEAQEAKNLGIVNQIVPEEALQDTALETAKKIAQYPLPALIMLKECINSAFDKPLSQGIRHERDAFHSLFATADQKEGFAAFCEKRPPKFTNN